MGGVGVPPATAAGVEEEEEGEGEYPVGSAGTVGVGRNVQAPAQVEWWRRCVKYASTGPGCTHREYLGEGEGACGCLKDGKSVRVCASVGMGFGCECVRF